MGLSNTMVVDWVVPTLFVVAWLPLWWAGRSVRFRFFAAAIAVSILCFVIGAFAGASGSSGSSCEAYRQKDCGGLAGGLGSESMISWWVNGLLGFVTCGVLAILTLVVELLLALLRRAPDHPAAE